MGLFGMLRTSASGMAAQANRLSTVADNIANVGTTGYKRASVEFSSLTLQSSKSEYISGSVEPHMRYGISEQGSFKFTTSVSDLAIKGNGFFVVSDEKGQTFLTRAGSFVPDSEGNLINAAGYRLMGYSLTGGDLNIVANGTAGLQPVAVGSLALQANPSNAASLFVNLPADSAIVAAANLPAANASTAEFAGKSSFVAYDNLGKEVTLDVYWAKSGANTWQAAVYDHSTASASGGFPYSSGPLTSGPISFDPSNGKLASSQRHLAQPHRAGRRHHDARHVAVDPAGRRLHRLQGQRQRQRGEQGRPGGDLRRRPSVRGVRERQPQRALPHCHGRCSKPRQPHVARRQRVRDHRGIRATCRSASPRTQASAASRRAHWSSRRSIWRPS